MLILKGNKNISNKTICFLFFEFTKNLEYFFLTIQPILNEIYERVLESIKEDVHDV